MDIVTSAHCKELMMALNPLLVIAAIVTSVHCDDGSFLTRLSLVVSWTGLSLYLTYALAH